MSKAMLQTKNISRLMRKFCEKPDVCEGLWRTDATVVQWGSGARCFYGLGTPSLRHCAHYDVIAMMLDLGVHVWMRNYVIYCFSVARIHWMTLQNVSNFNCHAKYMQTRFTNTVWVWGVNHYLFRRWSRFNTSDVQNIVYITYIHYFMFLRKIGGNIWTSLLKVVKHFCM